MTISELTKGFVSAGSPLVLLNHNQLPWGYRRFPIDMLRELLRFRLRDARRINLNVLNLRRIYEGEVYSLDEL